MSYVGRRMFTRKSTVERPPVKIRTHSLVSNLYVDVINHDLRFLPHPSQSRVNLHEDQKHFEYFLVESKESIVIL